MYYELMNKWSFTVSTLGLFPALTLHKQKSNLFYGRSLTWSHPFGEFEGIYDKEVMGRIILSDQQVIGER